MTKYSLPFLSGNLSRRTGAMKGGQRVTFGFLAMHNGNDPAILNEIKMYSVGNKRQLLLMLHSHRTTRMNFGIHCVRPSAGSFHNNQTATYKC